MAFLFSCTELEPNKLNSDEIDLTRSSLSKESLDSTLHAEEAIKDNPKQPSNARTEATSANYALQATVSATSTYPGYSVSKIKDGSRNTTVGPSYSWANNYPDGTRLPESVFLKWSALKTVNQIDIYTSSGYALRNYTVQFRTTTTASWITLFSITSNTSVFRSHTFADVSLLEIQIICELGPSNQSIYGRLNEVEVYGPEEPTLPSISTEDGMLVFSSSDDVDQTIEYLEFKYDQYSDAFAAQYPGLTADQFADMEETMGFNDDQPLIDFENQYGISSLRATLAAQEDYWLANTAGDSTAGQNPDDLYMDEYEMRTLVNSSGYLKVGTTYYIFLSDGSYYTSSGGGVPVALASTLAASGCRSWVGKSNKKESTDKNWRFKWKIVAHDGPFPGNGKVKTLTKSYRKKNGHWKKRGAIIGTQVYGDVVGQDCTGGTYVESLYKLSPKPKRRIKAKVPVANLAVKQNQLHGLHYHEKVGNYTSSLSW